jgi:hypothetical protein
MKSMTWQESAVTFAYDETVGSFAREAVIRGRARWHNIGGVIVSALFLAPLVAHQAGELSERLGMFDMGSLVYKRAQWSSTVALAACLAVNLGFATWLLARTLRGALGLPDREIAFDSKSLRGFWFWTRFFVGGFALIVLYVRADDEVLLRRGEHPVLFSLGIGTAACLLFAYDVPRLIANAVDALRTRLPVLLTRSFELDALPTEGRVRARGTLVAGDLLSGGGVSVALDVDPERTVIEGSDHVGTDVEVIGEVTRAPDAGGYRNAPSRIGPGRGMLYVFEGRDRVTRRLLSAAAIELSAAGGMVLATVGLLAFALLLQRWVR